MMRRPMSRASFGRRGRNSCRHGGGLQDVVLVVVFGNVIDGNGAVPATRRDHRDLLFESHEAFEDGRRLADACPGSGGTLIGGRYSTWPLPS